MLANPSKFQFIVLNKSKGHINTSIQINDITLDSKDYVELLGIRIDDKLTFDSHISDLCRKSGGQLNSIFRFKNILHLYQKN